MCANNNLTVFSPLKYYVKVTIHIHNPFYFQNEFQCEIVFKQLERKQQQNNSIIKVVYVI